MRYFRTPLDLPLLLFLVSAFVGYWVSYDQATSSSKLLLLVAAVIVFYVLALLRRVPGLLVPAVWLFLLLQIGFVFYFLTQTDFTTQPTKFAPLTAIGKLFNQIFPQLVERQPQPNMAAFSIEIGLPFAVALAVYAFRSKNWIMGVAASIVGLWLAFGLVLTTSRGAFVAYFVVIVGAVVIWLISALNRRFHPRRNIWIALAVPVVAALALLLVRFVNASAIINSFGTLNISGSALSRLDLYSQTWQLIQEYYFTGAGLGGFSLVLSAYGLMIDVPFLGHAHNLFLAVWIEQGILGFLALVWMVGAFYAWCISNRRKLNWLSYAGIVAASVWLLHGLTDTALYESRALPIMFVPFGFAISSIALSPSARRVSRQVTRPSPQTVAIVLVAFALVGLIVIQSWESIHSMWEANLGSLAQAQSELPQTAPGSTYADIRKNADLTEAETHFKAALNLNPQNAVANRRLGMIALAREDYDDALGFLVKSWTADPDSRATRKALGYTYAWMGQEKQAAALLGPLPEVLGEAQTYQWWWGTQGKPDLAQRAGNLVKDLHTLQ